MWTEAGKAAIQSRLQAQTFPNKAKNVILFIGDGMGISTVTAARIFDGQSRGESGEENFLSFEQFPHVALSKTYNHDAQVPDSAGTASALLTGAKTRIGVLGVSHHQPHGQCEGASEHYLQTLVEKAEIAGLRTGVVTTARLTHATPGSTYAHSPSRDWEDDSQLTDEAKTFGCKDIARQFIEFPYGDGIDVAMGGGRKHFLPNTATDPEYKLKMGGRQDGRNLIKEWQSKNANGVFAWNKDGFDEADTSASKFLGLFERSHMQYETDRAEDGAGEPSLAEMTEKAIQMLSKGDNGYVLLVEGGRIDHAHHAGNARRALKEAQAFSQAVKMAQNMVDLDETLIIVTADHSHVFTMAGYPARGNPILGLVHRPDGHDGHQVEPVSAKDGKPYTTLGYYNGPGAVSGERPDLTETDTTDKDFKQQSLVPTSSETHSGEDVAIYATGAGSSLISGVMEQNVIYHVMDYALREKWQSLNKD
jgi:alkaline phosphatase